MAPLNALLTSTPGLPSNALMYPVANVHFIRTYSTALPAKHGGHMHAAEAGESAPMKFLISGSVAWTFELMIGHFLEFTKISKQTSTFSYAQIVRNMVQTKGLIGVLDGFFPWGSLQCFAKGASFGFGQAAGLNLVKNTMPDFWAEVVSGGIGGAVQGFVMSPLLLLKTRVMTKQEMRAVKGTWATTVAASRIGVEVVNHEGPLALMKGSLVFSSKRVADWMTRFYFAELCNDWLRYYHRDSVSRRQGDKIVLTNFDKSLASMVGGGMSATVTLPIDVVVATMQSAGKAGQKVSVMSIWREQMKDKGISGLIAYSSRGYLARVLHVGATTVMMKTVSSMVYELYNKLK